MASKHFRLVLMASSCSRSVSELSQPESPYSGRLMLASLAGVCVAAALLFGCLFAKYFVLGDAINRGLMKPTNPLPGMICVGLAFAAHVYSAFCIGLADGGGRNSASMAIFLTVFAQAMLAGFVVVRLGGGRLIRHGRPTQYNNTMHITSP